MSRIVVYTDGGSTSYKIGGWAFVHDNAGAIGEANGFIVGATSQQCELIAAVKALEGHMDRTEFSLFSDSQYLVNGITDWLYGWLANGWKTYDGKPVKNQVIWKTLGKLNRFHDIRWRWVKGHSGVLGNERADALVADALKKGTKFMKASLNVSILKAQHTENSIKAADENVYAMSIDSYLKSLEIG